MPSVGQVGNDKLRQGHCNTDTLQFDLMFPTWSQELHCSERPGVKMYETIKHWLIEGIAQLECNPLPHSNWLLSGMSVDSSTARKFSANVFTAFSNIASISSVTFLVLRHKMICVPMPLWLLLFLVTEVDRILFNGGWHPSFKAHYSHLLGVYNQITICIQCNSSFLESRTLIVTYRYRICSEMKWLCPACATELISTLVFTFKEVFEI